MKKVLALDPGDQHIGTAISDELHIVAEPHKTIKPSELETFLVDTIKEEDISTVVIGYPKTMRGTISAQTQKSIVLKEQLEKQLPEIKFILWDERLTSKSASKIKKAKNKVERLQQHSIAAAIILQGFLDASMFN